MFRLKLDLFYKISQSPNSTEEDHF